MNQIEQPDYDRCPWRNLGSKQCCGAEHEETRRELGKNRPTLYDRNDRIIINQGWVVVSCLEDMNWISTLVRNIKPEFLRADSGRVVEDMDGRSFQTEVFADCPLLYRPFSLCSYDVERIR